jgi:hypothetical protein
MKHRSMVDSYFNEKLQKRNPVGQFLLTKGRISENGIFPGELLVFSYLGEIVYLAKAQTHRLNTIGPEAAEYPFYFCVDVETIVSASGNLMQMESQIKARKNILKTQGWPIIKETPEIERIWNQFKAK